MAKRQGGFIRGVWKRAGGDEGLEAESTNAWSQRPDYMFTTKSGLSGIRYGVRQ
jgi:hypothetical protein